jgi:hypothetical protein
MSNPGERQAGAQLEDGRMTHCVHHVPGRARFKLPQLQHDPAYAGEIEQKVLALDGVTGVEVNQRAWSMIVHYDVNANPLDAVAKQIGALRPANGENGAGSHPVLPRVDRSNGHHAIGGPEMSRVVGQAIGQAIFATLVQRTLDRSLLSLLTGLR